MNKNIKTILGLLAMVSITSCEIHDPFDEVAAIGHAAPYVFWEFPSSSAAAGDSVGFVAQYYAKNNKVKNLEVWYGITEDINMQASCPLVTSFSYVVPIDQSTLIRQVMKMAAYPHLEAAWDASRSAYFLTDKFPTSRTLRTIEWKEVETFEQDKFDRLFPDTFITSFRKNLYPQMKVPDMRKMYVSTGKMTSQEFRDCTDYTIDDNSNDTIWSLKPGKEELMQQKYNEMTFDELIYDAGTQKFKVEYSKTYKLNARFKAIDEYGTEGVTQDETITLR